MTNKRTQQHEYMTIHGKLIGKQMADGLVGITSMKYGNQLWSLVKMRKPRDCAFCGIAIEKGTEAFAPITKGYNRMHRFCTSCAKSAGPVAS